MYKIIATIELDNNDGLGKLFWRNGDIWCKDENGREYPTNTPCEEAEAENIIARRWSYSEWNLEFVD